MCLEQLDDACNWIAVEMLPVDNILCESETGLETVLNCIVERFTD